MGGGAGGYGEIGAVWGITVTERGEDQDDRDYDRNSGMMLKMQRQGT